MRHSERQHSLWRKQKVQKWESWGLIQGGDLCTGSQPPCFLKDTLAAISPSSPALLMCFLHCVIPAYIPTYYYFICLKTKQINLLDPTALLPFGTKPPVLLLSIYSFRLHPCHPNETSLAKVTNGPDIVQSNVYLS